MKHRIAFILPYFGNLPSYFSFFINSIKSKPFTLLVFTDATYSEELPVNCEWNSISLDEFVLLVEKRTQRKTSITNGYKLCDFRPMYGEVLADYLIGFDFWGNLDPDVIMGDFAGFIDDELLANIDVYSGITEYLSGSFFLVRNTDSINKLWRQCKDLDLIFSKQNYLGFDEVGGRHWNSLKEGKSILECHTDIQSFTALVKLAEQKGILRPCFKDTTLEPKGFEPVQFNNGKIIYQGNQFMMLHLLYFKTRFYFTIPNHWSSFSYINSFGFYNYNPTSIRFWFSVHPYKWLVKKISIQFLKLKTS